MPIIPAEDVLAIAPWRADRFDAPPAPPVETPPPETPAEAIDAGEVVADFALPTAEEIERIHNEAQQAGYAAGRETGYQEGFSAGQQAAMLEAERLRTLADNLQQALATLDQEIAETVLDLALEVARQVVRTTLREQPESLLPVIREAIALLPLHHGGITLQLNPSDAALIREHLPSPAAHQPAWHVAEDPGIEAGGCLVRAGNSEIDATVATRWRHVLATIGAVDAGTP